MAEFDQFAGRYARILDAGVSLTGETSEYFAEYKARYVRRFLPADFRGRVLDYGCGVGLVSRFLAQHLPAAELAGFDPSEASIAKIPAPVAARGRYTHRLEELGEGYDLVLVANVMHHVPPRERLTTLRELAGRMSRGGRLLVIEHNPLNPATRWIVASCPLDRDAVLLWPSETKRHLEAAGLRVGGLDYIAFFPAALAALRPLEPRLRRVPLGAQYAVVASRT